MRDIIYILATTVLAGNIIFVRFEGLCSFFGTVSKKSCSRYMVLATGFTLILSTVICRPLVLLVLRPLRAEYLSTVLSVFVIACLVQIAVNTAARLSRNLASDLGFFPALIVTNAAVLSTAVSGVDMGFTEAVMTAVGVALGYALASFLFAGIRERIDNPSMPESFRGTPAVLFAAAVVSLAFYGFEGVINGIFGM